MDGPIGGRFLMCDEVQTRNMPQSTADSGTAVVLEVGPNWLSVEAKNGWYGMRDRWIERASNCPCHCHREPR